MIVDDKGDKLYVESDMSNSKETTWNDSDGKKRNCLSVNLKVILLLLVYSFINFQISIRSMHFHSLLKHSKKLFLKLGSHRIQPGVVQVSFEVESLIEV